MLNRAHSVLMAVSLEKACAVESPISGGSVGPGLSKQQYKS